MVRRTSIVFLAFLLLVTSALYAQDRRERGGGRGQRPADVNLLDKEKAADFLGITEKQQKDFFKEIDALAEIFEPYVVDAEKIAKKLNLPAEVVTQGMAGGFRRGGGGDFRSMMESFESFTYDDNKIRKNYEDKEKDLEKHLANIEKMLNDEQKKKFSYTRPAGRRFGGRRGGGGGGDAPQPQLLKPTFKPREGFRRRG